ncbi:MAG: hypothetical protein FIA97_03285 [Methylococcaceae bacterium]|nr:hypothetical protein [Methylococcaceae bacterium]
MNIQIKSLLLGFGAALGLLALAAIALFWSAAGEVPGVFREQRLPSGKVVQVTSFLLTWGDDHGERLSHLDQFALEYVATHPDAEPAEKDAEAREVFELIRPVSELWGFDSASVAAFRQVKRKGAYDLFLFSRSPDGDWSFNHLQPKVFIND